MPEPRREIRASDNEGENTFLGHLVGALGYARKRTAEEGAKGNTRGSIQWMVYASAIAGILVAFGVVTIPSR